MKTKIKRPRIKSVLLNRIIDGRVVLKRVVVAKPLWE